jgi:2-dehydro-3-deoxygluconokinase
MAASSSAERPNGAAERKGRWSVARPDRALDLVCLGEPLVEFVRAEHAELGWHYRPGFGGDTSNAAIAAARQGARVGYLTALGQDPFGDSIVALWTAEGVDSAEVRRRADAPTGIYFVDPHPSGRRFSYFRKRSAASLYGPDDLPGGYIAGARALHLSAITQAISPTMRAASFAAIQAARAAGTLVSYDTNLRLALWPIEQARATVAVTLALADIVFPSDDEALELWGLRHPDAVLDHVLAFGPGVVVLKRGSRGAVVATPEARVEIPAAQATPVDATGAGDAFAGGFLARYLETGDPVEAGRYAARVAAGTVSGYGAVAPIPRRGELLPPSEAAG